MIVVDTSVWIDHLHTADHRLVELLAGDEVATHELIIEEIAAGSVKKRGAVLAALGRLRRVVPMSHDEVMALLDAHRLWGKGLSVIDLHLLGSTMITPGARLWTRDKGLATAARRLGVVA